MPAPIKLEVWVSEDASETSNAAACRAYLAVETLRGNKLTAGCWARVTLADDTASVVAQLWPSVNTKADSIQLSSTHLRSLSNPTSIKLVPLDTARDVTKVAKSIELDMEQGSVVVDLVEEQERLDSWLIAVIREQLMEQKYITIGLVVEISNPSETKISKSHIYRIKSIIPSTKISASGAKLPATTEALTQQMNKLNVGEQKDKEIYLMNWKSEIHLDAKPVNNENQETSSTDKVRASSSTKIKSTGNNAALPSYINIFPPGPLHSTSASFSAYATLGGLSTQIAQVRGLLDLPLSQPHIYTRFGLKPPRGILLYGPPGTGKTHLARAIASSTPGCSCIVVNGPELSGAYHGETEERVRAVFEEARRREPCIIVLDEVDAICPRREGGEGGEVERRVVATLLTLMDGMSEGVAQAQQETDAAQDGVNSGLARVVVIAATNRPNAIDPALRRPGRFDREIEIGIPDSIARFEILSILLSKIPHNISQVDLQSIADRTHGYVGADLSALVREAGSRAIHRWIAEKEKDDSGNEPLMELTDLTISFTAIRPSAMREIFLEPPKTPWSSIGGQDHIKQKLKECVEWPITRKSVFKRLGVEAPRGVLLYGPPGCSKTLMAKALATESGVNFMAVKGPELLNKFVGESEKAVREIFRKARAASPSIIFFDEIDSLAVSRSDGSSGSGLGDGVLTSLLNEMDGVETLSGVVVVAATNRPDSLDPALLRPGRLDRILYVGPPDFSARKQIFRIRFAQMSIEPNTDIEELARITDGCSGAEIVSICQDAALAAMNDHSFEKPGEEEDDGPEYIGQQYLLQAAREIRRRITPAMIAGFERWRDASGVRSA